MSELRSRLSALDSPGNEAQVAGNEAAYDGEGRASTGKYKNSNLDDEDKAMLIERIRNVMEDTDSICSMIFRPSVLPLLSAQNTSMCHKLSTRHSAAISACSLTITASRRHVVV